jgi:phytanoyl-CoA hydroxylase
MEARWSTVLDLDRYWEDGFVLLPRLFEAEALARFEARFEELALGEAEQPPNLVVMQDIEIVKGRVEPESPLHAVHKLMNLEEDPTLFSYTTDERLLEPVRQLIGADLVTLSTNIFNKPPGVAARHPFHQDLRYFTLRPADGIVASWTAISRTTRENGCLAVLPGSHRLSLRSHGRPDWEYVNSGFFAAEGIDRERRVHVEMAPGDTLLFHPLLVHGSGRNRTSGFRRAISTHFASTRCRHPEGPRKRASMIRPLDPAVSVRAPSPRSHRGSRRRA